MNMRLRRIVYVILFCALAFQHVQTFATTAESAESVPVLDECLDEDLPQAPKKVEVEARPRAPRLGDVVANVKNKVPVEVPGWFAGMWSSMRQIAAPHVQKVIEYGGEMLRPGEEIADRCKRRRKTRTSSTEGGLDACALLDVSWSLGRQLGALSSNASSRTAWWLAREVPRVILPFHLLWVDVAVDISPVTSSDVASIILHQRPYLVVQACDVFSAFFARVLQRLPMLDFLMNARYDKLYIHDPACPLVQVDGLVFRAPLTPDGFCETRPCQGESSITGQFPPGEHASYCECDLPTGYCRLRVEPLRDFQVLVDEPLAFKRFAAHASSEVAWVTVPEWLPPWARLTFQGLFPRYLFNFLVGIILLYSAETLAESRLFHAGIAALLGLFSGLVLAGLLLNHVFRTVRRLEPFSGLATLLTSATAMLLYQRLGRHSLLPLTQQLLGALWADGKGQLVIVACALLGVGLTWGMGWFLETEEEAKERPGWLHLYFNGQHNIRVALTAVALFFLWRAVPTPDLGVLLLLLVLTRGFWGHALHRLDMYLHRSPQTHRFLARASTFAPAGSWRSERRPRARIGDEVEEEEEEEDYTTSELQKLRAYVQRYPEATHRVRHGKMDLARFREGGEDFLVEEEDEDAEKGWEGRRVGCCVQ